LLLSPVRRRIRWPSALFHHLQYLDSI